MDNESDIIKISTTMDFSMEECARIPEDERKRLAKVHLPFQLGNFISKNFDELPIKYLTSKDVHYKQGVETHEISISLAKDLVPITLHFGGKEVKAYVPKDAAEQLGLRRDIESIALKGENE